MLQCNVKNCRGEGSYPLKFEGVQLERVEAEFNPDFLKNMLPRLDWSALYKTAFDLGISGFPEAYPEDFETNLELQQLLHSALLETKVNSGNMVCKECNHIFPIKDGIANMLLAEHEI